MGEIVKPMRQYVGEHSGMKYVFFGGKGGVGKTVFAGATAHWFAKQGRRTMLASTNPVHSLSSLLGRDVLGKHTPVTEIPNLFAYEIDTKDTIELMFKNEYDVYVFDTAPTANARRLLGMSKVYSLWVNKMLKSREEARTLREMLSFTKKKEDDPL